MNFVDGLLGSGTLWRLLADHERWKINLNTSAAAIAGKTANASAMPLGDLLDEGEGRACAAKRNCGKTWTSVL